MSKTGEKRFINVPIPALLYQEIEQRIKGTDFKSVSDYVIFVLTEVVSEEEAESVSKEDEESVKDRLRALGYLD